VAAGAGAECAGPCIAGEGVVAVALDEQAPGLAPQQLLDTCAQVNRAKPTVVANCPLQDAGACAAWLATEPMDMRGASDAALARVVKVFGAAHPHQAYLFANRRANRMKVLVHDGIGTWLAARRPLLP